MSLRTTLSLCAALGLAAAAALSAGGVQAKSSSQKECSEKYQAAKAANALNGLTYNQFRKQCAAEAREEKGGAPAATPTTAPVAPSAPAPLPTAAPAPPPAAAPTTTAAPRPAPTTTAAPARPPVAPASTATGGNAVYPTAVSTAYSTEKPGKARMKTCLDQYHANKAASGSGNGGMRWIQAGGGYYSECNKRLKS